MMTSKTALDLFAGTGWGVACKELGIREFGVEIMPAAIASRDAAGFDTPYFDVWDGLENPEVVPEHDILIASPPCQTFSVAGNGEGREALTRVNELIRSKSYQGDLRGVTRGMDDRTALVLTPLAYAFRFRPESVVLEQVPTALPVWESVAEELQGLGYSTWTGVLDAYEYGVPQKRKRAVLIASREQQVQEPPVEGVRVNLDSIRPDQAGLVGAYTSRGTKSIQKPGNKLPRGYRSITEPAFTATSKVTTQCWYPSWETVTEREAALMQSYPEEFPFRGTKTDRRLQIGNAVPPKLAEAILRVVL